MTSAAARAQQAMLSPTARIRTRLSFVVIAYLSSLREVVDGRGRAHYDGPALQGAPRPRAGPSPPEHSRDVNVDLLSARCADMGALKGDPMFAPSRQLPERPSLEQLRKQAKDLLRDAREADAGALARMAATPEAAVATPITLAQAQFAIAREYGFPSWPKLVGHVESVSGGAGRPLIRPIELAPGRRYEFPDGTDATTDDVFAMFVAARDGDVESVQRLVARRPPLATVEYNYTPPIHFA